MDASEFKAFPTDFTKWITANVVDGEVGQAVVAKWGAELEAIERVVREIGEVDFEWNFGLVEFRPEGAPKYIAHKLGVTVMNVAHKPQVTYIFRINDENKIVEWDKYAGALNPDNNISVH